MSGHVYVQTNDATANEVVVYGRDDAGRLQRLGSFLAGGRGSGKPHLQSQSSLVAGGRHVFVTNAGSDELPVFGVRGDDLHVLDRAPSRVGAEERRSPR